MLFSATLLASLLPVALALDTRAPLFAANNETSTVIPGKYIVKLRDGASDAALTRAIGRHKTDHVYTARRFKGFAGALDAASLDKIRSLPEVEFVEEDAEFNALAIVNQLNARWGLARLSTRTPWNWQTMTTYRYDNTAGAGTCSYIIDTGIYTAHPEFGGRAVWGANFVDSSNTDGNGHGTAVAGVVGATTYGVAKQTIMIAVKVLNASGSGTTSGVIAGINWVATDSATRYCPYRSTANISIGGSYSAAVNAATANLVNAGVFVSVAAGGSASNVANFSPASEPSACTVGATTRTDTVSASSNYGPLLDIWAPGEALTTWNNGGTNTLSGTSFAAAHITGLGSYLLRWVGSPGVTPGTLCQYMKNIATVGALSGVPPNTVNLLAYNGAPWPWP